MSKKLAEEPLVPKPNDEDGDGCWNCRFCVEVRGDASESGWSEIISRECRFNPPVPILWDVCDGIDGAFEAMFGWPDLTHTDASWCSHHKPRRGDEGQSTQEARE